MDTLFSHTLLEDVDNEQIINARDTFEADLRAGAVIIWQDEELERLYREALEAR